MWNFFLPGLFIFCMWMVGTYDKFPELMLPLLLIYMAVISPALQKSEFQRKWGELEKRRMKAVKANNLDQEVRIEEERTKLEEYNIPLTLGHLNTFRKELDSGLSAVGNRLNSIEERLKGQTIHQ